MNPRKKHNSERIARHKAVKRSGRILTQEWKGTDPAVRDAKRKVRRLFRSTVNGNGR